MNLHERCDVIREKTARTTADGRTVTNTFRVDFTAATWDDVVNMAVRTAIINRQATMRKNIANVRNGSTIDIMVNVAPATDPGTAFTTFIAAMDPAKRAAFGAALAENPTMNVMEWSAEYDAE